MSEASAWTSIKKVLDELGLDPKRVENVVGQGFPDIDYLAGNIELKYIEEFPARVKTSVRMSHFTGEQAGWLARRWKKGGNSWLLVRVSRTWFLFDGWTAMVVQRGATINEWFDLAVFILDPREDGWGSQALPESPINRFNRWLCFEIEKMEPYEKAKAMRLRACRSAGDVLSDYRDICKGITKSPFETEDDIYKTERGQSNSSLVDSLLWYWES